MGKGLNIPDVNNIKNVLANAGFENLANLADFFVKEPNLALIRLLVPGENGLIPELGYSGFEFGSRRGHVSPLQTLGLVAEAVTSLDNTEKSEKTRIGLAKLNAAAGEFLKAMTDANKRNLEDIEDFDD